MRTIDLTGQMPGGETYIQILVAILAAPMDGRGVSYEELRTTVPLIEALEAGGDWACRISLEEAQWELLCERVKAPGVWGHNGRELLDLTDRILNARPDDRPSR